MKYIDAEKLKAQIKGIIAAVEVKKHPDELGSIEQCMAAAEVEALNLALDCVKELQQEQPKQKKKCNDCPYCVDRKDQYGWHFKGCFGGPHKGKFIAEIDECPLEQEQPDEQPEYGYLSTEYVHGRKSKWNVGDVLAYYICTSNEEGEYPLGKIVNVEFDEEDGWIYTFEDERTWDEQSLIEEGVYKIIENRK